MKTFTIFKSDDLHGEELYGHGMTAMEVSEKIGIDRKGVYSYAKTGHKYRGEYYLVLEENGLPAKVSDIGQRKDVEVEDSFNDKWENMRSAAKLLKTGKGKIVRKNGKKYVKELKSN